MHDMQALGYMEITGHPICYCSSSSSKYPPNVCLSWTSQFQVANLDHFLVLIELTFLHIIVVVYS